MRKCSGYIVIGALVACGGGDSIATVTDTVVVSVAIAPDSLLLQPGQPFYLTAVPRNAEGQAIPGLTATWSSNDESIATVQTNGVLTSVAPGEAVITGTVQGHSKTMPVTVIPAVRRIAISPPDATLENGFTLQ